LVMSGCMMSSSLHVHLLLSLRRAGHAGMDSPKTG
jgi:hypothetical protein